MIGTGRMFKQMIEGVNAVKVLLYKVVSDELLEKFDDIETAKKLSGTIVNEIFDNHHPETKQRYEANKALIEEEIKIISSRHSDLIALLTDALRVNFTIEAAKDLGKIKDVDKHFNKAIDRKILNKGGDAPEPETFFNKIQSAVIKYGVIELLSNVPWEYRWDNNIPKREYDAYSYCPKCKAQYREGFEICSDCNIDLIDFADY